MKVQGSNGPTVQGSDGPADSVQEPLRPLLVGIVLVEILTIAGLYWMGVHFAA